MPPMAGLCVCMCVYVYVCVCVWLGLLLMCRGGSVEDVLTAAVRDALDGAAEDLLQEMCREAGKAMVLDDTCASGTSSGTCKETAGTTGHINGTRSQTDAAHSAWAHSLPDGSQVLSSGTVILADGTQVLPSDTLAHTYADHVLATYWPSADNVLTMY